MPPGHLRTPEAPALAPCRDCQTSVSLQALTCPHCGAPRPAQPTFHGEGYEWTSRATWVGYPILHIAFGSNAHGKAKIARGIIAIGQIAVGGLAIGITSIGFIALGVVSLGLLTCGVTSVALIAAFGVQAIAPIAFGVSAIGWLVGGVEPIGWQRLPSSPGP